MWLTERIRVISTLGVVEILAWGSTFYLLALLAGPIGAETGWSPGLITAGVSLGLLASGLVARRVGRFIQAHGGRRVMAAAMGLNACGLCLLGAAQSPAAYVLAWLVIGVGMGGGLYDAAFSTLGRIYGAEARRPITALTLWGGFASTVCWPITALLLVHLGWRGTCLAYAAVHLTVTLPLCWFALPRRPPDLPEPLAHPAPASGVRTTRGRFWLMAIAGTIMASIASLWSVHLMTVLTAQGYALAAAVGLGALIGPSQVGARAIEMAGGGRHHPIWTALASACLVSTGFLGLALGLPASAALIAFGAGNGLWSIARGALPLAVFGARDYARTMGGLATPALIGSAAAPTLGAWLLAWLGPTGMLLVLAGAALIPVGICLLLLRTLRPATPSGA